MENWRSHGELEVFCRIIQEEALYFSPELRKNAKDLCNILKNKSVLTILKTLTDETRATKLQTKYNLGNFTGVNDKLLVLLFLSYIGETPFAFIKDLFVGALIEWNPDDYTLQKAVGDFLKRYGHFFRTNKDISSDKNLKLQKLQEKIRLQLDACKTLAINAQGLLALEESEGPEQVEKFIRSQRRKLAGALHPDLHPDRKGPSLEEVNRNFQRVIEAGQILADEKHRSELINTLKEINKLKK